MIAGSFGVAAFPGQSPQVVTWHLPPGARSRCRHQVSLGLLGLINVKECDSEVVQQCRVVRCLLQAFPEFPHRPVGLAGQDQGGAQVRIGRGITGIQIDGLFIVVDSTLDMFPK